MKIIFTISTVLLAFTMHVLAQDLQKLDAIIESDLAKIKIVSIGIDSFPFVEVVISAETIDKFPVFGLEAKNIFVLENNTRINIEGINQITDNQSIHLAIVLDHSGSMLADNQIILNGFLTEKQRQKLRKKSPLTNAKKSVKHFISSFRSNQDSASVIGFSSKVDLITPHTSNLVNTSNYVDDLESEGRTAFFDAVDTSLSILRNRKGFSAIVALTDGEDNSSSLNENNLIEKSKNQKTPIYIIGLGAVNKFKLKSIARRTNGEFYYTKESTSLEDVYMNLSKRIKALYTIRYKSNLLDETIDIPMVVGFKNEQSEVLSDKELLNIDEELIKKIKEEKELTSQKNMIIYSSIFLVLVSGLYIGIKKIKNNDKSQHV
jgi:hypothetical protein